MKNISILLVAAALLTVHLAAHNKDKAASAQSTVAAKWIAAWNSHDPEKLIPIFTPDVTYEDVAFGQVSHGSDELRKFAASEFESSPDMKLELVSSSIQGGHGFLQWVFSGTDKGVFKTGKKFSVRGVSILELRDGKISRSQDYYDVATVMRQVGLLPADH